MKDYMPIYCADVQVGVADVTKISPENLTASLVLLDQRRLPSVENPRNTAQQYSIGGTGTFELFSWAKGTFDEPVHVLLDVEFTAA